MKKNKIFLVSLSLLLVPLLVSYCLLVGSPATKSWTFFVITGTISLIPVFAFSFLILRQIRRKVDPLWSRIIGWIFLLVLNVGVITAFSYYSIQHTNACLSHGGTVQYVNTYQAGYINFGGNSGSNSIMLLCSLPDGTYVNF